MEKKLLNIVCAVVRKDDKYLCMQRLRKGPDYIAEKWEFPGGKVEENETDFDALRREIKEEMDWDIYVGSKLGNIKYDYPTSVLFFLPTIAWLVTKISSSLNTSIHVGSPKKISQVQHRTAIPSAGVA